MATTTPVPPMTLGELAQCYSPAHGYATIAVRAEHVDLGDVVDHTDGLMTVTEITRRHATWTLGGYNPATPPPYYWMPGGGTAPSQPPLIRHVTAQPRIRARRPAGAWRALAGHTKKITSHNPRTSGCYTLIDGYDAACSCGWTGPEVYKGRLRAQEAITRHRADAITAQTHRDIHGLAAIERLEDQLGDVLPWRFDHGAQAQLRGLTTPQAQARLAPWADALGVRIEDVPADAAGLGGERLLWVDSRAARTDGRPGLDIRAYPTPAGEQ